MRPPVDGTGPKLRGTGGWLFGRHGGRTRRSWKELRLATDADAGRIVAAALIDHDGSRVGPLLDQVDGPVASSAADGAFDRDDVHAGVASRHAAAAAAAPPRPGAAAGDPAGTAPTRRDRRIEALAERGRKGRQKASGGPRPARPGRGGLSRRQRVIGDAPRPHTDQHRATEAAIAADALSRMPDLGRPGCVRTA